MIERSFGLREQDGAEEKVNADYKGANAVRA